jgi:hypothetical protein
MDCLVSIILEVPEVGSEDEARAAVETRFRQAPDGWSKA